MSTEVARAESPSLAKEKRARLNAMRARGRASPELDSVEAARTPGVAREDEVDELSPEQPVRPLRERYSDAEEEEEEEASEIPDEEAARGLQARRRQSDIMEVEAEEEAEPEEEREDEEDELDSSNITAQLSRPSPPPSKPSPAVQRAPKSRGPAKPTSKKPRARKPRDAHSNEKIPVTVYRLTSAASDSDTDPLASAVPMPHRPGVSSVDVLATMFEEYVNGAGDALAAAAARAEADGNAAERREFRTKLRAVEAFGEEARARLLDVAVALDGAWAVRRRVRAAMREKVALRAELLRVRGERERVALRMDGVRTRHEEEERENEVSAFPAL